MEKNFSSGDYDDQRYQLLVGLRNRCYMGNITNSGVITQGPLEVTEDTLFCARTFDGFTCWDDTPAGAVAFQKCPNFIMGFDPKRTVYKNCSENGTWFVHPETNKVWTNYTTCVDMDDLQFRTLVNNLYVSGYSISIVLLVLSLIIFTYFRSLRCTRIRIHMHLFSSFTINNVVWIIWYKTIVNSADVIVQNRIWCQLMHILTYYFMVTGYCWMFCESLHLHLALVVVFVKDELAMKCFMIIGWGVSFIIIVLYVATRLITSSTSRCWIDQGSSIWIIIVPVGISLIVSFVFLVNVVRVLVTKLRPIPNQSVYMATCKAARATCILIPLFGLHFLLIPVRPPAKAPGEHFYEIFSAILTSLQGACVSILFCFTNHDVVTAIKFHYARYVNTIEEIPMTGATGESLANTRETIT